MRDENLIALEEALAPTWDAIHRAYDKIKSAVSTKDLTPDQLIIVSVTIQMHLHELLHALHKVHTLLVILDKNPLDKNPESC